MRRAKRRRWSMWLPCLCGIFAALWLLAVLFTLSVLEQRATVTEKTAAGVKQSQGPREGSSVGAAVVPEEESPDDVKPHSDARLETELLHQLLELGYEREVQFESRGRDPSRGLNTSSPGGVANLLSFEKNKYAPIAYITCISNEEFVDGALVLGASLRKTSIFLQAGVADLGIIVTSQRIGSASKKRLQVEGTYNHVFEVPSLAHRAPQKSSLFRDTFDKVYIFNLTMYEKIVFMDADMIALQSMDKLFSKPVLGSPDYVGAIGGKEYFQTGMMVISPTCEMFNRIYDTLIRGTPPNGLSFAGHRARDGVLLRHVFGTRFRSISVRYSRNLNPRYRINEKIPGQKLTVAVHLRGIFKPWFDKKKSIIHTELGKKEYGFTYLHWWTIYEENVHKKSEYYRKAVQMQRDGIAPGTQLVVVDGIAFGGPHSVEDGVYISPLTHLWMQRHSKDSHLQLLSSEDIRRRNRTVPSLQKIASPFFGLSCDDVCTQKGLRCSPEALFFSSLNDCEELRSVFGCNECEIGVYWRLHPGNDFPALEEVVHHTVSLAATEKKNEKELICRYNYLHDERGLPNCSSSYPLTRRYCPCVPAT